jgi:hypothetical protein
MRNHRDTSAAVSPAAPVAEPAGEGADAPVDEVPSKTVPVAEPVLEAPAPAPPEAPVSPAPKPGPPPGHHPNHPGHHPNHPGNGPGGHRKHHIPSPHDIAELPSAFALTANVHDPEPGDLEPPPPPASPGPAPHAPLEHEQDEVVSERGLRGLVGGGASQVSVAAALRARDAARPTDADLAAAESDLVIVRRGWVPREELPRPRR